MDLVKLTSTIGSNKAFGTETCVLVISLLSAHSAVGARCHVASLRNLDHVLGNEKRNVNLDQEQVER